MKEKKHKNLPLQHQAFFFVQITEEYFVKQHILCNNLFSLQGWFQKNTYACKTCWIGKKYGLVNSECCKIWNWKRDISWKLQHEGTVATVCWDYQDMLWEKFTRVTTKLLHLAHKVQYDAWNVLHYWCLSGQKCVYMASDILKKNYGNILYILLMNKYSVNNFMPWQMVHYKKHMATHSWFHVKGRMWFNR
jgi:hypothetical protein